MNEKTLAYVVGGVGLLVGAFGIGLAIGYKKKNKDVANKIDVAIGDISRATTVEIKESIVKKATIDAVNRETSKRAKECANEIRSDIKDKIHKDVSKVINEERSRLRSSVENEINRQITDINIDDVQEEIIERAKNDALRKFNNRLEDIIQDFNDRLKSTVKIYESIESTLGSKANR